MSIDSLSDSVYSMPNDSDNDIINDEEKDLISNKTSIELSNVVPFFSRNKKSLKVAHININSMRHKFLPLSNLLLRSMLDALFLQETKIDESFPDSQFYIPNFKLYRKDVNSNIGGIMMYFRSDLGQQRRSDLEISECQSGRVEIMAVELILNGEKWLFCSVYKQPKVKDEHIIDILCKIIDKCTAEGLKTILVGDLNIDVSKSQHCLLNVFDVQGVKNIVKQPTCFKNVNNPSIIDLVISNVSTRLKDVTCIETGLSDFHSMVCFATKMAVKQRKTKTVTYRCYKKFNDDKYMQDLSFVPFHIADIFDDINDEYWVYETLLKDVINEHAPLKTRRIKHNMIPYMNSALRKATNVRKMLWRKFKKNKSNYNWEIYIENKEIR